MDLIGAFLPFIILMGVMYFMIIRPQKKQQQQKKDMLSDMKHGDMVVTIGGLHGMIEEVSADGQTVDINCEGVYLTFEKAAIARIIPTVGNTGIVENAVADIEEANQIAHEANQDELSEDNFND